jgi:hypothetical protein
MTVPFTTFTTRKWAVLTSKIDKLLIGIGIISKRCPSGSPQDVMRFVGQNLLR